MPAFGKLDASTIPSIVVTLYNGGMPFCWFLGKGVLSNPAGIL